MKVYDFTAKNNMGKEISLDEYNGQVLLIINTATKCGLTPQYDALEALYQKYKNQGFEILDFPSNQFLEQAPGTDEEIESFCTLTYNTTFPRFSKVDVNGDDAHPLFAWLRQEAPVDQSDEESAEFEKKVLALKPLENPSDLKWNFGKFLIDKNGKVFGRYSPAITPEKIDSVVKELIDKA